MKNGKVLLADLAIRVELNEASVQIDSRQIRPGDVFVSLPSHSSATDQRLEYIEMALSKGAGAIIAAPDLHLEDRFAQTRADLLTSPDPRDALAVLATAQYKTADLPFPVIGLTGTNGKTTCAYLLEHLYRSVGQSPGVLGTISYRWPGFEQDAPLTTPDCLTLHSSLAAMNSLPTNNIMSSSANGLACAHVDAAILEVSSHAIAQKRIAGISFGGAIFTNLTQDHLDFHPDMEDYFQTKARLFRDIPHKNKAMAINADDPYGLRLLNELGRDCGYSLDQQAGRNHVFLSAKLLKNSPLGLHLRLQTPTAEWDLTSPLVGAHNASNLAAVMALALQLGFGVADFACFNHFYGVCGRLERIPLPNSPYWAQHLGSSGVFVDYSHTPDSLIRAQQALKDAGFNRLITVFGCGGDRDRGKRPLMGKAVAEGSDVAVVTSDNPRTEDPQAIIAQILPGLEQAAEVYCEPDRREAIALALGLLRPGDALLVAGKGHETYQIIGTTKYPFSDQEILREFMQCK